MDSLRIGASDFVTERKGKLQDTYKIGEILGQGSFGTVRSITHKLTKEVRAVKILDKKRFKNDLEIETFFNEVAIQRALDHPNIAKLYEYYQDDKNFYLICEICSGGELFDKIVSLGSISEAQAAVYMRDILSVISYCHANNVVHRDLKTENFLLDTQSNDAHLKAIDFGEAKFFTKNEKMTELRGTAEYVAPEVIRKNYNEKCDEWSAGVIMYILLSGAPPFHGDSTDEIFAMVKSGKIDLRSDDWSEISKDAKDLIKKLLTVKPQSRITATQALQHKWFKNASPEPLSTSKSGKFFSNLQSFSSEMRLQQATYSFIASQLATKKEKEEIYKVFKAIDVDGNGCLSREELIKGFELIYGAEVEDPVAEVDKIMQQVDIDKSGEISYNEFVVATMNKNLILSKSRLKAAFEMFDTDNSGSIDAKELEAIMGKSTNFDKGLWDEIIREADTNGDGVIDFKEFCDMMLK